MSELDNLESLNNHEIRAKCKEIGLNVPVTDSSRKLLIKKLRLSMGGGGDASPGQKKNNRRETIHVSKPNVVAAAPVTVPKKDDRPANRVNNRRTIAAPSVFSNTATTSAQAVKELPVEQPAKISERRRSVREQIAQKISSATKPQPTIIIESEDEDDVHLVAAVEKAEKAVYTGRVAAQPPPRSSRSVSLSKTGVLTTSYNIDAKPLLEEDLEIEAQQNVAKPAAVTHKYGSFANYPMTMAQDASRKLPEPVAARSTYNLPLHQTLSSNRYSSPIQSAPTYSSSNLRRSTTVTTTTSSSLYPNLQSGGFYNEQSDDNDGEGFKVDENIETPFLSNFARNLGRIKAEPLGRSNFTSSMLGTDNDNSARRYRRSRVHDVPVRQQQNDSPEASLRRVLIALDNKYNLKRNFYFLVAFLLAIFLYVLFFV